MVSNVVLLDSYFQNGIGHLIRAPNKQTSKRYCSLYEALHNHDELS